MGQKKILRTISKSPNIEARLFTHEQLQEALFSAQDALERALIPFVLLDDLARQVYEQEIPHFKLNEISLGVMRRHWTKDCKSIFRMYVPDMEDNHVNIVFKRNEVPIILWIIDRDYTFFKNPDSKFLYTGEFCLPNPFDLYWKERNLVK